MKCPTCRLINPDTALRCDCGYDFQSGKMERPYHDVKTPMPAWIVAVLAIQAVFGFMVILGRGESGIDQSPLPLLLWASVVGLVYFQMTRGKNWARIALAILAFPIGLLFLLSSDLKSFIRERNKP